MFNPFKTKKRIFFIAFTIFIISFFINYLNSEVPTKEIKYSEFVKELNSGQILSFNINNSYTRANEIIYTKMESKGLPEEQQKYYKVLVPSFTNFWQKFEDNKKFADIEVKMSPIPTENFFITLIKSLLPLTLFLFIFIWMQRQGMSFMSKSTTQLIDPSKIDVTFDDIIGIDDVKNEVSEIVDFLKNPEKFSAKNAKMPKGIILAGPPGTGKTMLAKALAKEAGVPFFYSSGSSFVEMFVGLGASRVRKMFAEAQKHAPCIIFIDEIDTIGGKRGNGMSGSHDEKEGTLNELLTQMDGMETNNGVFVMGATNRIDMLDKALTRPGRFDRQIVVPLPSIDGRLELLEKLFKKYNIDKNLNIKEVARGLTGRSGAEITNLMNEAAIIQVRKNKDYLDSECISEALDKIIMGMSNGAKMNDKNKLVTAYHEAGHAIVNMFMPETDPVHKVTITPRGNALGVTMMLPEEDRISQTKTHLLSEISVLLAGYHAEKKFIGDVTTGSSNDIERATLIAKAMVTRLGMGKNLKQFVYTDKDGWGSDNLNSLSDSMKQRIEEEIEDIMTTQTKATVDILNKYENIIHIMAKKLVEEEVLTEEYISEIMVNNLPHDEIPEYILKYLKERE